MSTQSERVNILNRVQTGEISAEEGAELLLKLVPPSEPVSTRPQTDGDDFQEADLASWKRWWIIPLWVGVGIFILGSLLTFWALQSSGNGFWFYCAWLPLFLGVLVMILAWRSRTGRWIHLRIRDEKDGNVERIALSFPLPLRFSAWFLRTFGQWIPKIKDIDLESVIMMIDSAATSDSPLMIDVDDEEDGSKVQIYIG